MGYCKRLTFYIFSILSLSLIISCDKEKEPSPDEVTIGRGEGTFKFHYKPLAEKNIDIFYYLPTSGDLEEMPILFAMHGANRDGQYQITSWKEIAEDRKVIVFAPQFASPEFSGDDRHFPANEYQLGGVTSASSSFRAVPEEQWTLSVIEALFDFVKKEIGSNAGKYDMWGHSAGGQWTHRYMLFKKDARVRMAVASNPGEYTVPDVDGIENFDGVHFFPYSLRGTNIRDAEEVRGYFAKNMVVHAGTADTKKAHEDPQLPDRLGARAQGPTRYDRAHYFFNYGKNYATARGWEFNWRIVDVPNVGHSSRNMVRRANVGAADLLYKDRK